jgi:subtilisin family serine protease
MKKFILSYLLCFIVFICQGQRNPNSEILVFFVEGITQDVKYKNGQSIKAAKFSKEKLKDALHSKGIKEDDFVPALPNFKISDTLVILDNGQRLTQPDMTKLYKMKVSEGKNRNDILEFLNSLPEVLYAEPNGLIKPEVIPDDDLFGDQWGLRNLVNPGSDINAEVAWDVFTGTNNSIIAILDGGGGANHPDLSAKITGGDTGFGWDSHGIQVAGIAAAITNNEIGIAGVDWNALIHPKRLEL